LGIVLQFPWRHPLTLVLKRLRRREQMQDTPSAVRRQVLPAPFPTKLAWRPRLPGSLSCQPASGRAMVLFISAAACKTTGIWVMTVRRRSKVLLTNLSVAMVFVHQRLQIGDLHRQDYMSSNLFRAAGKAAAAKPGQRPAIWPTQDSRGPAANCFCSLSFMFGQVARKQYLSDLCLLPNHGEPPSDSRKTWPQSGRPAAQEHQPTLRSSKHPSRAAPRHGCNRGHASTGNHKGRRTGCLLLYVLPHVISLSKSPLPTFSKHPAIKLSLC